MAFLAAALPYITAGLSIGQTIGQANTAEQLAQIEADQLKKQAVADTAASVQTAKQERRRAELLNSRVRALAAASGTSLASPDIQNTLAEIDQQGEYNALAALHAGATSAQSQRFAAKTARGRGSRAQAQAASAVGGTILDFVETRYG